MSEFTAGGHETERQVASAFIGTVSATLFGPVPPQMSVDIYAVRWANPTSGSVAGYLQQVQVNAGYTTETATLIDGVALTPFDTEDSVNGEAVITKVSPGNALTAFATSASLYVRVTYQYRYGRG